MLVMICKAPPQWVQSGQQPTNTDWKALHQIADAHYAAMMHAFLDAVEAMRDLASQEDLVALLARGPDATWGRLALAWETVGAPALATAWTPHVTAMLQAAAVASQPALVALVPERFHVSLNVLFNQVNEAAVTVAQTMAGQRITAISETTLEGVRATLTRAFLDGRTPDQTARTLAHTVGLAPGQERQLANYQRGLEDAGVSGARQERLVRVRSRRLLRQRAETIARTETITTANAGQQTLYEASQAHGFMPGDMKRFWLITPDDRLAIVGPKTLILTIDGWKPVRSIKTGDLVATHAERFCAVTHVEAKHYNGPTVYIAIASKAIRGVRLTYGHPVLAWRDGSNQWINVEHLVATDEVYLNSVPCSDCGKHVLACAHYPKQSRPKCHACNTAHYNADVDLNKKRSVHMGKLNALRWADDAERKKAALRWTGENNPVGAALRARARNNYGMSWLERKMGWWLKEQGIAFIPQWFFRYGAENRRGFADFYLPGINIVIECDGPTHEEPFVRARDEAKDTHLINLGIAVLRFTDNAIRKDFATVASAIRERCCLARTPIKSLTHHIVNHQVVYNLTVEGDESFIAGGIVVHNCPICRSIPGLNPKGRGITEPFMTPVGQVLHPSAHPQCRCAVTMREVS